MGMKIRQESRVKTFFKRLFKLSRRKDKDGGWAHTKLVSANLYSQSSDSDLNLLTLGSPLDQSVSSESISKLRVPTDTSDNDLSTKSSKSPSLNKSKKNKQKGKKQSLTYLEDKYIIEPETTPLTTPNTDKKSSKRKEQKKNKKANKNLIENDLNDKCNADKSDNDMIDIDLDLVLSSFPSIRKPKKYNQIQVPTEADDNIDNHNRQVATNIHQVEAVIETSNEVPLINVHEQNAASDDENIEKWERLVIGDENESSKKKKRKRSKKNKHVTTEGSPPKMVEDSEKDVNTVGSVEHHMDDDELWKSSEPLVKDKKQTKKSKKSKKSELQQATEDYGKKSVHQTLSTSPASFPKRNKRNKKRGNVRHPEEDMEFELEDHSFKRPKHQVFLEDDIITEIEAPQEEDELSKRQPKRSHRRRLRLKFNKDKKKVDVKRYDELDNKDDENDREKTKRMGAKEVGRRMWKACKRGWKYLRVGLVYYTKAPSMALSANPIITRYDHDSYLGSASPTTSSRYY